MSDRKRVSGPRRRTSTKGARTAGRAAPAASCYGDLMQGFDATNPPFDRLLQHELDELITSLDVGYYRPGEVIVRQAHAS